MLPYNPNKFRHLVLYVAKQMSGAPSFGKLVLAKVLFWSDFDHFAATGEPITGHAYERMPFGPVPRRYDEELRAFQRSGELRIDTEAAGPFKRERPVAMVEPDMSVFSASELEIINRVISEHRTMTANQASERSHGTLAWQVTLPNEDIPYGLACIADPTPEPTEREYEFVRQLVAKWGKQ